MLECILASSVKAGRDLVVYSSFVQDASLWQVTALKTSQILSIVSNSVVIDAANHSCSSTHTFFLQTFCPCIGMPRCCACELFLDLPDHYFPIIEQVNVFNRLETAYQSSTFDHMSAPVHSGPAGQGIGSNLRLTTTHLWSEQELTGQSVFQRNCKTCKVGVGTDVGAGTDEGLIENPAVVNCK